jgi:hypothetical protein
MFGEVVEKELMCKRLHRHSMALDSSLGYNFSRRKTRLRRAGFLSALKPGLFIRHQMGIDILYNFETNRVIQWMMQAMKHVARPEGITVHGQC